MRVLTIPKNLAIGGTQINAMDLASALVKRGHHVTVASAPGPLLGSSVDSGTRHQPLPPAVQRLRRLTALRRLIHDLRPDIVHAYEVRNIVDSAYAAPHVPLFGSIMSTRVPWFLPESVPLSVGMPGLVEFTRRWRTGPTFLLVPPVPTRRRSTQTTSGLDPGHGLVVMVTRLVEPFKAEGIVRTIRAMELVGRQAQHELLIVGDGPARPRFETEAKLVNERAGRRVVSFAGAMTDPTPAYEAANVVVGNGAAVIRSVALGTPAVVVGRNGYSTVVEADSIEPLMDRGFYGVGSGVEAPDHLAKQILSCLEAQTVHPATRATVVDLYGIDSVAERLAGLLEQIIDQGACSELGELWRVPFRAAHYRIRRERLRRQAVYLGLHHEEADNHVFGRLRDMALPPGRFGTGRNRRSETDTTGEAAAGPAPARKWSATG